MISNLTIAGMILSLVMCIALPAAASIVAYKYRGNAGGSLMAFILGFAAIWVSGSLAQILVGITGITALMASEAATKVILGFALYSVMYAAVDFGILFYSLYYLTKTGIGKHKCLSLSGGYVCGATLPSVMNLIYYIVYAFAINKGTFLNPDTMNEETLASAEAFQQALIEAPSVQYFAQAIQFATVSALNFFLIMYMTRRWLENEKTKSSIVAGCSFLGFNLVVCLIEVLSSKVVGIMSIKDAYIVLIVVYLLVIAACIFGCVKVFTNFPHGREKQLKSTRQRMEEQQTKVKRSAWDSVNELNKKNAVSEDEENDSETETQTEETAEATEDDGEEVKY